MDEVNKFAHEGGDTSPETRKEIAARNKAADALAEKVQAANKARTEAADKLSEEVADAEQAYAKAVPRPDVVGAPEAETKSGKK